MKILYFAPLLMIFGGWGISYSDHASYSRPYPSAIVQQQTPTRVATTAKSTSTQSTTRTTTRSRPAPKPKPVLSNLVPQPAPTPTASTPIPTPPPAVPTPTNAPLTDTLATQIELLVFEGMNGERVKNGLSPLAADTKLASIARAHSADMIAKNYFSHTDPNGCGSSCRANNAGYAWQSIGENIYMMSGYSLSPSASAEKVVLGWMNSPGHRANILGAQYTFDGVGVVVKGSSVYVTAMYAKPSTR